MCYPVLGGHLRPRWYFYFFFPWYVYFFLFFFHVSLSTLRLADDRISINLIYS
jgi:hypothetical protein